MVLVVSHQLPLKTIVGLFAGQVVLLHNKYIT
jgi:hypothetical protein